MALTGIDWARSSLNAEWMAVHAREASELLKALAHEGRLMILCDLLHGEKSVGELERRCCRNGRRQFRSNWRASGSRGLCHPLGRQNDLLHHIANDRVRSIIGVLYEFLCAPPGSVRKRPTPPVRSGTRRS